MGTISVVKNIFNSGELSPKVYARSDIDKHKAGCKTLLNFVPLPQGGVQRRPGFQFITSAKNNNANVRLVPFQFSQTQAYILEAGNGYMRVFKDGGQVLDANNDAYEFATPWTENDLGNIQYSQSYDKLFVTHQNYFPREITRTAHNNWTIGNISFANAPSEWSANNGYPRTCTFYQDRLCFASSTLFPSRLWMSSTGSYNNMTTGTNDSDGMTLNLLSGTSDVIQWLASSDALIVGADSGMWTIAAATGSNAALSPTNKKADKVSYFGAAPVMPARLGDIIIHPGYPASKIRELAYSFESDGYRSGELSVLSDHLFESKTITQVAYQQNPFEIVWCLRSDGALLALTYMQEHKVVAWSRHTSGNVQSIATIQGSYETELWAAINRSVNNNTCTYIERLNSFASASFNNSFFVDSGVTASSNNGISTVTGLDHLEAETVSFLADGVVGSGTVSSGNLSLQLSGSAWTFGSVAIEFGENGLYGAGSANTVIVGLPYTSDLETMPVAPELKSGDVTFAAKRITEIQVRCRNSAGGSYGPDSDTLTTLLGSNNFSNGHIVNKSRREGSNSSKTEKTVFIRQTDPLPMNIDAIGMEVEVE